LAKKGDSTTNDDLESTFIPSLVNHYLAEVDRITSCFNQEDDGEEAFSVSRDELSYLERFLELSTDLLSQLHTRRFLRTLFDDKHVLEKTSLSVKLAKLGSMPELLEKYKFYLGFEIQDQTGEVNKFHCYHQHFHFCNFFVCVFFLIL
jgi:intron-binding protein aquarius